MKILKAPSLRGVLPIMFSLACTSIFHLEDPNPIRTLFRYGSTDPDAV